MKLGDLNLIVTNKDDSSLLEVEARGKLTHEDYQQLAPQVERMVAKHGKIRVLFDMVEFHGWEPAAMWDDAKFAAHHIADISRIAMIGDKAWEKAMSVFCRPFTKAELRYFDRSEAQVARVWIDSPRRERIGETPAAAGRHSG